MKRDNLRVKQSTNKPIKQCFSIVFILLLTSLSTACQVTEPAVIRHIENTDASDSIEYSQYYLILKTLNNRQLLLEEKKLLSLMASQSNDKTLNQGKLILLYSLPNPGLYQPYKAKSLLNEHLLTSNNMSQGDLAFIMLLRDQLNIQLRLLEKQARSDKKYNEQYDQDSNTIEQLKQQLEHVNKQLILLKEIDKNINERG
ncbi:hypothetical protein [Colwellia psychrerythraea]|uniref:Lipoprotein n=1 Tax=Colwellia psychrerythraea TaxID=28229 RepID=A0A099KZ16_COLPS|nr:hypothetical protein [Colwellia psychrerythraea]KGJ95450.1 hypothetical protein ND2E_1232 [Colwellia psychrerythraea]